MPRDENGRFLPADTEIPPPAAVEVLPAEEIPPATEPVAAPVPSPLAVPDPADVRDVEAGWPGRLAFWTAVAVVPGAAVGVGGWWLWKRWRKTQ